MPADAGAIEWPPECATCGVAPARGSAPSGSGTLGSGTSGSGTLGSGTAAADPPASAARAERPAYCSTCLAAHRRHAARSRALLALALLAGLAASLAFPVLQPRAALGWHLLAAGALALLPIAGLGAARPLAGWGSPPRVHGLGPLGACVERRELAEHLARAGLRPRALLLPPLAYHIGAALVLALALGASALAHRWHHPRVWIVNLTREPLWIAVDGELRAAVDPAGSDPARAALQLRLPRGERALEAFDDRHRRVASVRARVDGGRDHVYAPASDAFCFWLESTGYGRDATRHVQPLFSESRFFALDADVDSWFTAAPEPPRSDRRSTGGTLTALRQSPCARAPERVRQAASAIGP